MRAAISLTVMSTLSRDAMRRAVSIAFCKMARWSGLTSGGNIWGCGSQLLQCEKRSRCDCGSAMAEACDTKDIRRIRRCCGAKDPLYLRTSPAAPPDKGHGSGEPQLAALLFLGVEGRTRPLDLR